MNPPIKDRMTRTEWRAGVALAFIISLRMLGLFLVLPLFGHASWHLYRRAIT